ncbi:MAG TPA: hypothetical protein VK833_05220 [Gillisia sp.]|nr:hypothetical protein [Gillisia sp.]
MKIKNLHISIPLLLLTLLNVVSSSAFSIPSETLDLNSGHSYTLKSEQNTKAIFTEEASVSIISEIASNPDYFNSGNIGTNSFDSLDSLSYLNTYGLWLYNPDLRNLLSQNIFPFQFFW